MKIIVTWACAVFILTGCATSSGVQIRIMPVSEDAKLYYFFPTVWLSKDTKDTSAKLDITYISEKDNSVVCNISFYHTVKIPEAVSDIFLTGEGKDYALDDITVLFVEPKTNELRITSVIPINAFMELLGAKVISLKASVDGNIYQYNPPKEFYSFRNQFVSAVGN
ncbi:MAG: hypothetical protein LBH44_06685 [Treponema sp.]|jgi:hypothetical protein|nr:hypothetical protein [Treponema sp.]